MVGYVSEQPERSFVYLRGRTKLPAGIPALADSPGIMELDEFRKSELPAKQYSSVHMHKDADPANLPSFIGSEITTTVYTADQVLYFSETPR